MTGIVSGGVQRAGPHKPNDTDNGGAEGQGCQNSGGFGSNDYSRQGRAKDISLHERVSINATDRIMR